MDKQIKDGLEAADNIKQVIHKLSIEMIQKYGFDAINKMDDEVKEELNKCLATLFKDKEKEND